MPQVGNLNANRGEKAYGFFKTGETHGRFPVHIPLHIVAGAQDGPTLVVQAGASGLEIEPSLILPHVVNELDPAGIKGTLILAPLMNTSGFEFGQVNSAWDDKHLNQLGRGKPDGSVSEQLVQSILPSMSSPKRMPWSTSAPARNGVITNSPAFTTKAMSMRQRRWQ